MGLVATIVGLLGLLAPLTPPREASSVAGLLLGEPWIATELRRTCERESKCKAVGVHLRDGWAARSMYRNAARVGWLDPANCEWHQRDSDYWGVRGPWGASVAYTARHAPVDCYPTKALSIPLVGALVAGMRMRSACGSERPSKRRQCVRDVWAGKAKAERRRSSS